MSFGVVQLGQAATSLGEGELAYAALVRLVNSYWLGNMASMHNHRSPECHGNFALLVD